MTLASIGSVDFCLSFVRFFSGFFIPDSCLPLIPLLWQAVSGSSAFFFLLFCPFRGFSIVQFPPAGTYPASDELPAQPFFAFLLLRPCILNADASYTYTGYSVQCTSNIFSLPLSSKHSFAPFLRLQGSSTTLPLITTSPATKTNVQRDLGASSWPWSQKMETLDTLFPWVNLTCVVVERFRIHRGWTL